MNLGYNKNHGKWFASAISRAIRRFELIEQNDSVCVGLSGGTDSVTLLYMLWYVRHFSRLKFDLSAIHVRTSPEYDTDVLRRYCEELDVEYIEEPLRPTRAPDGEKVCAICARLKRGAATSVLAGRGIAKLAYGHHADDAAETLLMNLVENRRLSSFFPKVSLLGSPVTIVRPMIYLDKETIRAVHRFVGLPVLAFECPHARHNVREKYRALIPRMEEALGRQGLSTRVVRALERADEKSLWLTASSRQTRKERP